MPMNTSQKSNPYFTLHQKTQQPAAKAAESAEREPQHPLDDERKLLEVLDHLSHQQDDLAIKDFYPSEASASPNEALQPTVWFEPDEADLPPDSTADWAAPGAEPLGVSEQEMMEILQRFSQQADALEATAPEASSFAGSEVEPTSQVEWFSSSTQEHTSAASAPNFAESSTDDLEVSEQDVMGALHHLSDQAEDLTIDELYCLEDALGQEALEGNSACEEGGASEKPVSSSGSLFSGNLLARLGLTSLAVTGGGVGVWLTSSMLSPSADDPKQERLRVSHSELNSKESPGITATIAAPALDSLAPKFNTSVIKPPKAVSKASAPEASPLEPVTVSTASQVVDSNQVTAKPEMTPAPHIAVSSIVQERLLTAEDLQGLSDWDLTLLRNEIYARHGRHFLEPELQQYFESQSWYQPRHVPGRFPISHLSHIEIRNAVFIRDYQNAHAKFYQWE